jgi:hypothetical protein
MPIDESGRRRRALASVLSGVLDETAILQELWLQNDMLTNDSATGVIEFIDSLASRRSLDQKTRIRLSIKLFMSLRMLDSALPEDPWPAMQEFRPHDTSLVAPLSRASFLKPR